MNVTVVTADKLSPVHLAAWDEIQRSDPALDSPYFRPEFTQAVAAVRNDVEIGVLEENGAVCGFFPFQRGRGNVALPVGGRMSDFHGLIVRPETAWQPLELIESCGLRAWRFDHLPAVQSQFKPYWLSTAPSPYIDLQQGWDGYQAAQLKLHKDSFKRALRKLRQAEREAGPLRMCLDAAAAEPFDKLVAWKTAQYQRTAAIDVLAYDWTKALLQRILTLKSELFGGMIATLHIGDMLAALMLSMRSGRVMHAWFSAYNPNLAEFSPGLLLILELARLAPTIGIERIDLGKGPEEYKTRLMSGAIEVAEGAVDFRPLAGMVWRNWRRAYQWARNSPLRRPLLVPGRMLRNLVERKHFR